jgi:hypothetical protein
MDLFTALATLPLAPVRGVMAVVKVIQAEVDRQMFDPAAARRQLEEIDVASHEGKLTADDQHAAQEQIVRRIVAGPSGATAVADNEEGQNAD